MYQKLKVGQIVVGTVSGITNYGIFVNINHKYNGLIHISEVSDNYVKDLNEYVKVGEEISCKIIEIDKKFKKIKLSLKKVNRSLNNKFENIQFQNLRKMLPKWIDLKIKEIKKRP